MIANWLAVDQTTAMQQRMKGKDWRDSLESLSQRDAIAEDHKGIYEPTLFGLVIAIVLDAKGTRAIWSACHKVFALAKKVFKAAPEHPELPYEDFRARCGLDDEVLLVRAIQLLADSSIGITINNPKGENRTVYVFEHLMRYENLWEYVSIYANSAGRDVFGARHDSIVDLATTCHFTETLEVVHNGSDLVRKAVTNINSDPGAAITAARSLVEATLKWILHDSNIDHNTTASPAQLLKKCIGPIGLDDGFAKRDSGMGQILSGLETALHGLAKMRDELGDAHGRKPGTPSPTRRQARLAVGLATTLASFLVEAREAHKEL